MLRVSCSGAPEVPAADFFVQNVTREQSVVLDFPVEVTNDQICSIGQELARQLPDYNVFLSSTHTLAIRWMMPKPAVLSMARELSAAAVEFRDLARQLGKQLLLHLNVVPSQLLGFPKPFPYEGQVGDWEYWMHGASGCTFTHCSTGQELDVRLGIDGEFGVLDPAFFHRFMATTPAFAHLAAALPDAFHDTRRALSVLSEHGDLRVLSSEDGRQAGLIAPDALSFAPSEGQARGVT